MWSILLHSKYRHSILRFISLPVRDLFSGFLVYLESFSDGSPLALADIVKSRLFRQFALEGTESTPFGVSTPASLFPLLSQGDHPTLGTPCWYFHPCETPAAVSEVMKEFVQDDWTDGQRLLRWMEVWFMILGTAVDLNA